MIGDAFCASFDHPHDAALAALQAQRGLLVDGILGANAWRELVEAGYELGDRLRAALCELTPKEGEVFCLRWLSGLSYEEIAEIMDLPLGTVKTYIHRARLELRDYLADLKT